LELGNARIGAGDLPGAEAPLQDALRLAQSSYGATSLESGRALWALGMLRHAQGQFTEAKRLYKQSLGILETAPAPQVDISAVLDDLAKVYAREQQWAPAKQLLQREGRLAEAEPLLRDVVATRLSLHGPDHYQVGYARVSLAMLLHDQGNLAAAESEFRQALAIYDKNLPANHQWRAALLMHFARLSQRVRTRPKPTPSTPTPWRISASGVKRRMNSTAPCRCY
jgi:tetratricopeptide (TPR) repeat protein